jgi:hypothetical protein
MPAKRFDFVSDTEVLLITQHWGSATQRADSNPALRPTLEPIGEEEKFQLAKSLLLGVGSLFVLGVLAQIFYGEHGGGAIFETCKTVLPPIATLVIGYYFSEKASGKV